MVDVHQLKLEELRGLDADAVSPLAAHTLERLGVMSAEHASQLAERDALIKYKDAKLQKVTFELARAEGVEVRRQDRGDERRAAPAVRGDRGRGRGGPAGATRCVADFVRS
ncbi:hypothetical protein OOT46_25500 [Aquabacterium sp. A7-Y]|uniref:hypothetical protein n=1 Tax=Aquabacterium sp. A7-Y TaxID=1349605 RepID=UPI00223D618E|nr:hypothetical protein [Aquabacterium sp. A7-Y]MCW7541171.1 hypothetical protein [Aquabacterium sp. A7-Y]